MRGTRLVGLAALVCALVFVAGAGGATSPLPGGTSLDVTITSPTDGATLADAPFTLSGTAVIGQGTPVANTLLIYVVDISGSTSAVTASATACPDQNYYDVAAGTTLDCELVAVKSANQEAVTQGTVSQVGVVAFAGRPEPSGSTADAAGLDSPRPRARSRSSLRTRTCSPRARSISRRC
jgi:hypothetical protein